MAVFSGLKIFLNIEALWWGRVYGVVQPQDSVLCAIECISWWYIISSVDRHYFYYHHNLHNWVTITISSHSPVRAGLSQLSRYFAVKSFSPAAAAAGWHHDTMTGTKYKETVRYSEGQSSKNSADFLYWSERSLAQQQSHLIWKYWTVRKVSSPLLGSGQGIRTVIDLLHYKYCREIIQ